MKRLDILMVEKGIETSRQRAQALISSGAVTINGAICVKASQQCDENDDISIQGEKLKYVSRGGLKLEKALSAFAIDVTADSAIDIGASTGGFTDCLLQNGASRVIAIDVGNNQLSEKLRRDPRVTCMENTNFRDITPDSLCFLPTLAVCDVSFISLKYILPITKTLLAPNGRMVTLIKPQFEAGREHIGKNGVVKDEKIHAEVVKCIMEAAKQIGFTVAGFTASPIKGPKGNIEFLLYLKSDGTDSIQIDINSAIADIKRDFKGDV